MNKDHVFMAMLVVLVIGMTLAWIVPNKYEQERSIECAAALSRISSRFNPAQSVEDSTITQYGDLSALWTHHE